MTTEPMEIARAMIDRHGSRASAVVAEHAHEAELAGQTASFNQWRSVQAAIEELRRTERQRA